MGTEVYIIAHTERGTRLGADLENRVNAILRAPQRFFPTPGDQRGFAQPLSNEVQRVFYLAKVLILVMDLETAVRILAPLLSSRHSDPVVLVIDEAGHFVINLLSGYKSNVNQLANNLAELIGAQAVSTTAVESLKVPSFEDLAKQFKMNIEPRQLIPKFTDALLSGEPIVIWDRWGLSDVQWPEHARVENSDDLQFGNNEKLLVVIGYHNPPSVIPVKIQVMALRPMCLTVGISCSSGVTALRLVGAIRRYFREQNWSVRSIKQIVAIDRYTNKTALGEVGRDLEVSVTIINATEFPQLGSASSKLNINEEVEQGRAAELVAGATVPRGQLIGIKRRIDQVSIAVAFYPENQPKP